MIAALALLFGCEPSGGKQTAGTSRDSVPLLGRNTEDPGSGQVSGSPASADLRTALEQLLRGPTTAPRAGDRHSWFSATTAGALRAVTVDSAGHATVDFHDLRPLIPNASSSAGSALLLDELNTTVFQFPDVRSVEYRMEGSCEEFWEWLQFGCHKVLRPSR
jgi:hypothetical protein